MERQCIQMMIISTIYEKLIIISSIEVNLCSAYFVSTPKNGHESIYTLTVSSICWISAGTATGLLPQLERQNRAPTRCWSISLWRGWNLGVSNNKDHWSPEQTHISTHMSESLTTTTPYHITSTTGTTERHTATTFDTTAIYHSFFGQLFPLKSSRP